MSKIAAILFLIFILVQINVTYAYHPPEHMGMNTRVSEITDLELILMNNLGFPEGLNTPIIKTERDEAGFIKWTIEKFIRDWIREGGLREDDDRGNIIWPMTTRGWYHFHDPLKIWDDAGLYNAFLLLSWRRWNNEPAGRPSSAVLWGLYPGRQRLNTKLYTSTGDWSWNMAREHYYNALTADTEEKRETSFANCFRAVGQIMHLTQDVSVPAHVRNDVHLKEMHYENYFKKYITDQNPNYFNQIFPVFPSEENLRLPNPPSDYSDIVPISGLFDRGVYDGSEVPQNSGILGLAEYTNANFFSLDTILSEDYPHPNQDDIESLSQIPSIVISPEDYYNEYRWYYYRKTPGDPADYIVAAKGYFTYYQPQLIYSYILDEVCFTAYAKKLIPRAMGYSSKVLDYFFRGDMDIRNAFVKFEVTPEELYISGLRFEVKNTTQPLTEGGPPELFENGAIDVAIQYKLSDEPQFIILNNVRVINDANDEINNDYVDIDLDFGDDAYIARWATNLSFTVIYKGELGGEKTNAVAAKIYQFDSKSSSIAFHYSPEQISFANTSNIFLTSPDGLPEKEINITNILSNGSELPQVYYHIPTWSPDGRYLAFNREQCMQTDSDLGELWCDSDNGDYDHDIVVTELSSIRMYSDDDAIRIFQREFDTDHHLDSITCPSFSPDGNQLVFMGVKYYQLRSLIVGNIDTGQVDYIKSYDYWTGPGKFYYAGCPAWSPKENVISYSTSRRVYDLEPENLNNWGNYGDICFISSNGIGENYCIITDYTIEAEPAWSPDGRSVLFIRKDHPDHSGVDPNFNIYIMDRQNGNTVLLHQCYSNCHFPTFSPDGLRIAFWENQNIYRMNINGLDLKQVTYHGAVTASPEWSDYLNDLIPSVSFKSDKKFLSPGETVELIWDSPNAETITIDDGDSIISGPNEPISGSKSVVLSKDTIYTITAENWAGEKKISVKVIIVQ